ncbi:polymer-forming cytoskeletal protein [Cognatilysobacter terrigena]|uniref:polymer-forming cytoskeletal protein n=1 Tax=Cognatilysobacter terrigena TaxID=2488749 RepID=UPI001061D7A3
MAIFPNTTPKRDTPQPETALGKDPSPNEFSFATSPANTPVAAPAPTPTPSRAPARQVQESLIASDLSIEGKINGAGSVRVAGRFTGDIAVEGDLTIEVGARVNGGVKARRVVVAGELEGNIESAQRVEVVESGSMVGDVKAGTVTVAPGARMRGMVEFGWDDAANGRKPKSDKTDTDSAA